MTKTEQIMRLWRETPDTPDRTRIIAEKVGCAPAYVRVVARQRQGGGISEIDRKYMAKCKADPEFRARYRQYHSKYQRERRAADPFYRAKLSWRAVRYRVARKLRAMEASQ